MLDVKKAYTYIKTLGYSHSKDDLGTYFDIEGRKFSVIKTGLWYTCYHNVRVDNNWHLAGKSQFFEKFDAALNWVVMEMQKNK